MSPSDTTPLSLSPHPPLVTLSPNSQLEQSAFLVTTLMVTPSDPYLTLAASLVPRA